MLNTADGSGAFQIRWAGYLVWAIADDREIVRLDSQEMPESGRHMIQDACNISEEAYDELKAGFLADLGVRGKLVRCGVRKTTDSGGRYDSQLGRETSRVV